MIRLRLAVVLLGVGLFLVASGRASADSCPAYNENGSQTFPGAYVGEVTGTCVIGALPNTAGITDNGVLSSSTNPDIYELYFGGGALTVDELLGNQGTGTSVDLELDSLGTILDSTSPTVLASAQVPYESGAGATVSVSADDLAAGYYAIDTYFATAGTADPQFELTVTAVPSVSTPEPGSALLLGIGLLALGLISTRRQALSF